MRLAWFTSAALVALMVAGNTQGEERRDTDRRQDERPRVSLRLGAADAAGIPAKEHHGKTGGGHFVVRQPSPDTLQITMTGLARAHGNPLATSTAHCHFDLHQSFTVVCNDPTVRAANLQVQG